MLHKPEIMNDYFAMYLSKVKLMDTSAIEMLFLWRCPFHTIHTIYFHLCYAALCNFDHKTIWSCIDIFRYFFCGDELNITACTFGYIVPLFVVLISKKDLAAKNNQLAVYVDEYVSQLEYLKINTIKVMFKKNIY